MRFHYSILLLLLLIACLPHALASEDAREQRLAKEFDYDDPKGSESRLLALASGAEAAHDIDYLAEILTQVARAQVLQGRFDDATRTLHRAAALPTNAVRPHVRLLVERGRLLRRQNLIQEAKACFEKAYQTAAAAKELALAADAAHMLAMMLPFDEARIWNDHGLAMAEASSDPMLRHWVGVLANNWGWRLDEQGDHAGAALSFARALACRRVEGDESLIRASEFALAVELRQLGMAEQALAIQQRLQQEATAAKEPVGEIVIERIHNLWTLKRNDEAREVATEALSPPIQKSLSTVQIEKIRTQLQALSGQSSH